MSYHDLFHAVGYRPHTGQARFHASEARFKVLIAGARFGKSLAAAKEVLPEILASDGRGWLVGPTYALTQPEFRYICDDLRDSLGVNLPTLRHGGRATHSCFETPWGAEVVSLSAQRPETLLGEELDWLILCEAAHLEADVLQRYLRARLATRGGRLVVPSTPHGFNWLHKLYLLGLRGEPGWHSQLHASWDNPLIARHEFESARAAMPEETFDEQFGGRFTSPAGAVYREFEPARHAVQGLKAPPGAIFYKGIDFGYTNPFCCVWAAVDSDGRVLVLHEYMRAGCTTDEHAAAVRKIDDRLIAQGLVRGGAWADPSGATEIMTLRNHGVPCNAARPDLAGGISLLRMALRDGPDGKPRLLVDADCRNLLREFELYRWQESSDARERVPRKKDDHALDALRYLVFALRTNVDWRDHDSGW